MEVIGLEKGGNICFDPAFRLPNRDSKEVYER